MTSRFRIAGRDSSWTGWRLWNSLGFVNFVALVEEKCAHKYGITLSLTETSSQEDGAFEDVGKFAHSLFQRLDKTSL